MVNCPKCSKPIENGAHFCSFCGYEVTVFPTGNAQRHTELLKKDDFVGRTLGDRFYVQSLVARGGMGVVYKAKDVVLDEIVALKILKQDLALEQDMINRFKREIKVARKIKHPNVCSIYDFGIIEETFFISMEFIEGEDLSDLLRREALPDDKIEIIVRGMINALTAAHTQNIIHRDLKPSNIKIAKGFRPVIMDFGIARHVGKSDLTLREEVLGTPIYMSPEQFQGATIDQRSDIYSFGVILYELYTGSVPFNGDTPIAIAMKHMQDQPLPPHSISDNVPPSMEKIILRCLSKEPEKRYQFIQEILADLEQEKEKSEPLSEVKKIPTILVADDDDDIRKLVGLILERNGYEVVYAVNGEDAISQAMKHLPSLICMDLMMPKMDGYQAAEFLISNPLTSHIPIVMITCKDDKEYKAYSKSIGVKQYLTKPIDLHRLTEQVKILVGV